MGDVYVVLDSGPFSLLCVGRNDTPTHKLAEYLQTQSTVGAIVMVPIMVVTETARGKYAPNVRKTINANPTMVLPFTTQDAFAAADLLHRYDKKSKHIVDASVIVTAARLDGRVTVITGDLKDLKDLTQDDYRIKIRDMNKLDE